MSDSQTIVKEFRLNQALSDVVYTKFEALQTMKNVIC